MKAIWVLFVASLLIITVSSVDAQMWRWNPLFDKPVPQLAPSSGSISGTMTAGVTKYTVGDLNKDGYIGPDDIDYFVAYMFESGPAPSPYYIGNINGKDDIDISDLTYLINYVYHDGPPPIGVMTQATGDNDYFDLVLTGVTFSDNNPVVNEIIVITSTVMNNGTIGGYINGGSFEDCPPSESNITCMSGGWGVGSEGVYVGPGESVIYVENQSFSISGIWTITRSFTGKGENDENDINPANNEMTVELEVQEGDPEYTCYDSDGGLVYDVKGYATIDDGATKEWDECGSVASQVGVNEVYCSGNNIVTDFEPCLGGCLDGACQPYNHTEPCGDGVCGSSRYILDEGDSVSVSIGGQPFTFTVNDILSGTTALLELAISSDNETNGTEYTVEEGKSYYLPPFTVYVEDVTYDLSVAQKEAAIAAASSDTTDTKPKTNSITILIGAENPVTCPIDCDDDVICTDGDTEICGSDVGECETGTKTCVDSVWGDCEGDVEPVTEACDDGLDNDCDGLTDEGCGNETGMILYYKFDEGAGSTAHDSSGNGHEGEIVGSRWVSGFSGDALEYDKVRTRYVKATDADDFDLDTFTIEAMVKLGSDIDTWPKGYQTIVAKEYQYILRFFGEYRSENHGISAIYFYGNEGRWGVYKAATVYTSEFDWNTDQWYHIKFVYDGTYIRLYVDGEEIKSVYSPSSEYSPAVSNKPLYIGNHKSGSSGDPTSIDQYIGVIDEVKIYGTAITTGSTAPSSGGGGAGPGTTKTIPFTTPKDPAPYVASVPQVHEESIQSRMAIQKIDISDIDIPAEYKKIIDALESVKDDMSVEQQVAVTYTSAKSLNDFSKIEAYKEEVVEKTNDPWYGLMWFFCQKTNEERTDAEFLKNNVNELKDRVGNLVEMTEGLPDSKKTEVNGIVNNMNNEIEKIDTMAENKIRNAGGICGG